MFPLHKGRAYCNILSVKIHQFSPVCNTSWNYKWMPKLNKQSALLQLVKGDFVGIDECIWLNYENGRDKQEHDFLWLQKWIETSS